METYFCIFGILSIIILVKCDLSARHSLQENIEKQSAECQKEIGINIEEHRDSSSYYNDKVKCYYACTKKRLGTMVNGKIIVEKIFEMIETYNPKALSDYFKTIYVECANKASGLKDECEIAGTFEQCLDEKYRNAKK